MSQTAETERPMPPGICSPGTCKSPALFKVGREDRERRRVGPDPVRRKATGGFRIGLSPATANTALFEVLEVTISGEMIKRVNHRRDKPVQGWAPPRDPTAVGALTRL